MCVTFLCLVGGEGTGWCSMHLNHQASGSNQSGVYTLVESLGCAQLFVTPWTAACQASLTFTISQHVLKLMSIESVMPSNHLIVLYWFLLYMIQIYIYIPSFLSLPPPPPSQSSDLSSLCYIAASH